MRFDKTDAIAIGFLVVGSIFTCICHLLNHEEEEIEMTEVFDRHGVEVNLLNNPNIKVPQLSYPSVSKSIAEHDVVDLGLPSGNLWAVSNLGSENVFDSGFTFEWHMTHVNLDEPSSSNYSSYIGDAAKYNWGDAWRVPSISQITELLQGCVWMDARNVFGGAGTSIDGMVGISKTNGNVILFPFGEDIYFVDLWTSSQLDTDDESSAQAVHFEISQYGIYTSSRPRHDGKHIRPVVAKTK